jgi:hypothetical protein
MARIRTIKPIFWSDEKLGLMPRDVRLLFLGLISAMADDVGRCKGNARIVRFAVFPYDEDITATHVESWLCELERVGRIIRYTVHGEDYIAITNWSRHQRVEKPQASQLPAPPSLGEHEPATPGIVGEHSGNGRGAFQTDSKGEEGKGGEEEQLHTESSLRSDSASGADAPTPTQASGRGLAVVVANPTAAPGGEPDEADLFLELKGLVPRGTGHDVHGMLTRLAVMQQAVASQRGRRIHDEQLVRYKIGVAFAYWAQSTGHTRTVIDKPLEKLLRDQLKLAKTDPAGDLSFVLYAIDGVHRSDWHSGRGPRGGEKHDWLKDIFRDRQTAQELAERIRAYRDGEPHATATEHMELLTGEAAHVAVAR